MRNLKPKPIIAETLRTWRVPVGMVYALVTDVERNVWIVESCPAGTYFWTVQQAAQLSQGVRTRAALHEAVREGHLLEMENLKAQNYERMIAQEKASERKAICIA